MKRLVLLIATLATLTLPTIASAHRPATHAEAEAMIYHARGIGAYAHISVDEPPSFPLVCAKATIATVVKGSQWGGYAFDPATANSRRCERWGSNGIVYEHKVGRTWYVVTEASGPPSDRYGLVHGLTRSIVDDISRGVFGHGF